MEWWQIAPIVVYVLGFLVWFIGFIIDTVEKAGYAKRAQTALDNAVQSKYSQKYIEARRDELQERNATATWAARMVLASPLWPAILLFVLLRDFVRVLKPFIRLVFPSLDKAAKQRKAEKEEADAQARLYPTER